MPTLKVSLLKEVYDLGKSNLFVSLILCFRFFPTHYLLLLYVFWSMEASVPIHFRCVKQSNFKILVGKIAL